MLLRGNQLSKGARSSNRSTAISIGAEGVDRPTPEIRIESNVLTLEGSYRTVFVTNHTATPSLVKGQRPATGGHAAARRRTECTRGRNVSLNVRG